MTSFDRSFEDRLREAVGEPMTPAQVAALDARLAQSVSRRPTFLQGRTLRRSVLLVAAIVVALPLAAIAGVLPGLGESPPPPELEARVTSLFMDDRCVTPVDAEQQINSILAELGYADWGVAFGTGAADTECVGAGIDAETRHVLLVMALSPEVREGLDAVREQLYRECRTQEEAAALVESALVEAGMEDWRIESGSISVPNDRVEEIEHHVANGCWVYSGTGWRADGTRIFWIAGD